MPLSRLAIPLLTAVAITIASFFPAAAAQEVTDSSTGFVTITGTVYDSLSGRPLSGALVQLATSDLRGHVWSDRTDMLGDFRISGVQPGNYLVGFSHPFLDSLGLEVPPRKLRVEGSAPVVVPLSIPTPLAVRGQLCPATGASDSTGLMLGFLRDADSGLHLDSGRVVLEWTEVRVTNDEKEVVPVRRTVTANANSAGWYALCGIPTAGPVAAHAEAGTNRSGYIDVRVPPRGVLHRDFDVPQGAAAVVVAGPDSGPAGVEGTVADAVPPRRGSARIAGSVRDRNGRPLGGAQVMVWGTDIATHARDDGTFALDKLPAGTQTLEARQIGYAPRRVVVNLATHRTDSVTVMLDKIADVLSEVKVYGEPSLLSRKMEGFRRRARLGFGHFITRTDLEKRAPLRLTDMIHGIAGIAVERYGTFDYKVVSSDPTNLCHDAIVYVDGHKVVGPGHPNNISVNDLVWLPWVVGIEVYTNGIFAPAEFGGGDTCPRVLVWTSMDVDLLDRASEEGER